MEQQQPIAQAAVEYIAARRRWLESCYGPTNGRTMDAAASDEIEAKEAERISLTRLYLAAGVEPHPLDLKPAFPIPASMRFPCPLCKREGVEATGRWCGGAVKLGACTRCVERIMREEEERRVHLAVLRARQAERLAPA